MEGAARKGRSVKVFVTGGAGFFASWLIPALEAAGHEVVAYDLKNGQDLQDVDATAEAMRGCEAVIHLAAYPHFRTEIPAQNFERRNIIGTARVIAAMRKAGIKRLVYTSSGAIYGFGPNRSYDGWVRPPISEKQWPAIDDWALLDAYGGSKLACEAWLEILPDIVTTALRINCIEPHHGGAKDTGAHWGWWCSQALAARAFIAALERGARPKFLAVNVAEPNDNMELTRLKGLLGGE